jgi:hypothetical protein
MKRMIFDKFAQSNMALTHSKYTIILELDTSNIEKVLDLLKNRTKQIQNKIFKALVSQPI